MKTERKDPEVYARHLPHIQPRNGVFFVTTRLAGSLPKQIVQQLKIEYQLERSALERLESKDQEVAIARRKCFRAYFNKFDQLLDDYSEGPTWLKKKEIAKIVHNAFLYFDNERYKMVCFTIMSNHVHLVLYQLDRVLFRIMQSLKRYSGREANKVLGRTGHSFWQDESFDRLVRDLDEFRHWVTYTMNNPVEAGLCGHWRDWPYSYIRPGFEKYIVSRSDL